MKVNDIYHNTCNDQPSTWTITHIHDDDKVTVYSPQSNKSYIISQVIFEDTMRALGFQLVEEKPAKYTLRFLTLTPIMSEHDTFDQAIRAGEKVGGWAFQIELGDMVCVTYSTMKGLKFTKEYKSWYESQQSILAKVEGS